MDNIVYEALSRYFHTLETLGYMPYNQAQKLLVLIFYKDYLMEDYRGLISECDYCLINQALECLYGSSCLIPYPDYNKMGSLQLGSMSELAHRVNVLEDTKVLKVIHDTSSAEIDSSSDITILAEES